MENDYTNRDWSNRNRLRDYRRQGDVMRTNRHPEDYNHGRYAIQGDKLKAVRESWARLERAKAALTEIIGRRGYMYFEMDQPTYVQTSNRLMTEAIEHELDRYECSCTPVHEPCAGCQNLYDARRENENVRS